MKSNSLFYFFFIIVLPLKTAQALTLIDVWELAQENDPIYRAVFNEQEQMKYRYHESFSQILPNIHGQLSFADTKINPQVGSLAAQTQTELGFNKQIGIEFSQKLFSLKTYEQIRYYKWQQEALKAKLRRIKQELIFRTISAYLDIVKAYAFDQLAQFQTNTLKLQLNSLEDKLKVRFATLTDIDLTKAALAQAQSDKLTSDYKIYAAIQNIRILTGRYDYISLNVNLDNLPDLKTPLIHKKDYWLSRCLKENKILQMLRFQIKAAKQLIQQHLGSHLPEVTFFGRTNHSLANNQIIGTNKVETITLGVLLNFSLLEGGSLMSKTNQARHAYYEILANFDKNQSETLRDVNNFYQQLLTQKEQIQNLFQGVQYAKQALASTLEVLKVGTKTILDYLTTVRNTYQIQQAFVQVKFDFWLTWLQLKLASGVLDEEDILITHKWLNEEIRYLNSGKSNQKIKLTRSQSESKYPKIKLKKG